MRKLLTLVLILALQASAVCQEIVDDLKPFTRIVASPRINVVLKRGDRESIRLVYRAVTKDKVNINQKGKTLRIFLDRARKVEPTIHTNDGHSKHGIYEGVSVTAYITYRDLESLEIRGTQELTCLDLIDTKKFVLRAYGENEITFAALKTDFFKVALYGENTLKIKAGKAIEQKYRLFGENKISSQDMKSSYTSTSIFGEAKLHINTSEEVIINAFGEPVIDVDGGAHVNRRLIFGKAEITRR